MNLVKDVNIDHFFTKVFNADTYNCAHFACDVWEHITDLAPMREKIIPLLQPLKGRRSPISIGKKLIRLDEPLEPCMVLMHRNGSGPHVGVYFNGKVLHITDVRVEFVPLRIALLPFDTARFYR